MFLGVNSQVTIFSEPTLVDDSSINIDNITAINADLLGINSSEVSFELSSEILGILFDANSLSVLLNQESVLGADLDIYYNISSDISSESSIEAIGEIIANKSSGIVGISELNSNLIDANNIELLAFPDALGYGKNTTHARNSSATVYRVTNLNDSGAGSLREALTASGYRYIIFETSGTIVLSSNITVNNPNVYVAGQTAPSPGIIIRDYTINIRTNNVVIRHLSMNLGDEVSASGDDAFKLTSSTSGDVDVYNVVIDNCTIKWAVDENVGMFQDHGTRIYGITYQQCIFAEPLDSNGAKNVQVGTDDGGVPATLDRMQLTLVECMFSQGNQRNPLVKKHVDADIVNCIIYNWGNNGLDAGDNNGDGFRIHLRKCIYRGGVDTTGSGNRPPILLRDTDNTGRIYCDGNELHFAGQSAEVPTNQENLVVPLGGGISSNPDAIQDAPVLPIGYIVNIKNIASIKSNLPLIIGSRPTDREAEDTRIINDYLNGTGSHKIWGDLSHPSISVNTVTHTIPENPHEDSGNGYHNIETWLEGFLINVE